MSETRTSFYILIPLFSVLFALLLAEIALSIFAPVPFSLERNMYYEPDPYTGFRHKPGSAGSYLNDVPANANSRGLRDDEVEVPKPADVFRILVVGDSFTVGASIRQEDAYPQELERLLQSPGTPIEVVNAGTGGWGPFQYAQYVEHYADEYEPDLLLLGMFVGNDTYVDAFAVEDTLTAVLGRRVSREAGSSVWGSVKVFLYERSHIARLALTQGVGWTADFTRARCDEFDEYFLGVQKTRLANHVANPDEESLAILEKNVRQIGRIKAWSDERGIPLVVFVIPDENQINTELQSVLLADGDPASYDFDRPQSLLRPLFALQAIDWVDLRPSIQADTRCLYMNDSHWTPEGHALVAKVIHDYLRYSELVPREPERIP